MVYNKPSSSRSSNNSSSNSTFSSSTTSFSSTTSTSSSSTTSSRPSKSSRRRSYRESTFGLCPTCNEPNTHRDWCRACNSERFRQNFKNWTSGSEIIDNFIRDAQLSAVGHNQVLEWIPYDRFKNLNFVAKGGFAKVYSACWKDGFITKWDHEKNKWERTTSRKGWSVALKILYNSANLPSEFFEEVKACVRCGGGFGIVRCYGISKDPNTGNFIIVLYYAHHGNLRIYLEQHYGELDWTHKLGILKQIAEGLKKIHQAGYVHKDFHSGNILQGKCTEIADLGFTGPADKMVSSDKLDSYHAVYGVLPYVSPEVLRGKQYTCAADIYSFGIIMWEVAECLPPFSDRAHDGHLALDICRGVRPKSENYIPKPFLKLMERCWNATLGARPSAHELYQTLHKWYWHLKDDDKNEITAAFNIADDNASRLPTPASSRPVTQTHPLAVYTSRLLVFDDLPEPTNKPLRTNSIEIVKDNDIEYVTRQFEEELIFDPESRTSTSKIDIKNSVSEVTFEPEEEDERYVTRQYDTELTWEGK